MVIRLWVWPWERLTRRNGGDGSRQRVREPRGQPARGSIHMNDDPTRTTALLLPAFLYSRHFSHLHPVPHQHPLSLSLISYHHTLFLPFIPFSLSSVLLSNPILSYPSILSPYPHSLLITFFSPHPFPLITTHWRSRITQWVQAWAQAPNCVSSTPILPLTTYVHCLILLCLDCKIGIIIMPTS